MLCILSIFIINSNAKILSSTKIDAKSLNFDDKKEKVNNIMMRALTGVLAKKALKQALSKQGKQKLADKETQERNLMDLKPHVPKKNHRVDSDNFWTKAEQAVHKKNKQ
jgi:hypothetical protein